MIRRHAASLHAATLEAIRLIALDGRRHPSVAVNRRNDACWAGIDPFTRVSYPVLTAFRDGAARGRHT